MTTCDQTTISACADDILATIEDGLYGIDDFEYEIEKNYGGIGAYECHGYRGYDSGSTIAYLKRDSNMRIHVIGENWTVHTPEIMNLSRTITVGGCDGDHAGRCRNDCGKFEIEIKVSELTHFQEDGQSILLVIFSDV